MSQIEIGYLVLLNLVGLVLCAYDKFMAIRHQWRIPGRTFFLLGLIGGAIGILIGMILFHHKTSKPKFVLIIVFDLIINVIAYFVLIH